MTKPSITEELNALAAGHECRSKSAQLRDHMGAIETALAAGVSRSAILKTLAAHGLKMSPSTFSTILGRLRKESTLAKNSKVSQNKKPVASVDISQTEDENKPPEPSYNPRDLDTIINSTPDLEALAKLVKRKPKK